MHSGIADPSGIGCSGVEYVSYVEWSGIKDLYESPRVFRSESLRMLRGLESLNSGSL